MFGPRAVNPRPKYGLPLCDDLRYRIKGRWAQNQQNIWKRADAGGDATTTSAHAAFCRPEDLI